MSDSDDDGHSSEAEDIITDLEFRATAQELAALIDRYDFDSLSDLNPFQLAELYCLFAELKDESETAREAVRDTLVDEVHQERDIPTEYGTIRRVSTQRRVLKDDGEVLSQLRHYGVDQSDVTSVDQSKVNDVISEIQIDESEIFDFESWEYVQRFPGK